MSDCRSIKSSQGPKETQNFRLGKNVWKNAKIRAESLKAVEIDERLFVRIKAKVREYRFVDDPEQLHNGIILQYVHQSKNFVIRTDTFAINLLT